MKKLMLVTVVTFASVSALASKARLNALQDARHIQDIQEVFQREPDQVVNYEAATVEFGGNQGTTPEAEGGFIRKMGDSAWSLYLGRSSTTYQDFVGAVAEGAAAAPGLEAALLAGHAQSNPLQVTYGSKMGDISWGIGALYATSNSKTPTTFGGGDLNNDGDTTDPGEDGYTANVKQNVGGLLIGANNGVWDIQGRVGLIGETESEITAADAAYAGLGIAAGSKLEVNATSSVQVSGGYRMDSMYYYGRVSMGTAEVKIAGTKALDLKNNTEMEIGAINSLKKDGTDFFYGASVITLDRKTEGSLGTVGKTQTTTVPLLVGVESEVNTWLTLRGALTQPISFLSSEDTPGGSSGTVADNTITTVGAGIKWGRANIDWVAGTGSTGSWAFDSAADPFTQVSVTYAF